MRTEDGSEDRRPGRRLLLALALVAALVAAVVALVRPQAEGPPSGGGAPPPAAAKPLEAPGGSSAPVASLDVAARPGVEDAGEAEPREAPLEPGRYDLRVADGVTRRGVRAEVIVTEGGRTRTQWTDDEGRTVIVGGSGEVVIQARAGALRSQEHHVSIQPGSYGSGLVLLASGGLRIDGVVVDPDGRPVPGAAVQLFSSVSGGSRGPVASDVAGRFAFDDLLEDRVGLGVSAPGFVAWYRDLLPEPGGTGTRVVLARGVRLEGQVRLPDGAPAPGASVETCAGHGECDADGRFELLEQPGGDEVEVVASATDAQGQELVARRTLRLDPAATTRVTLDLERPAALAGTLLCRGRVVLGLRVEIVTGGRTSEAHVEHDGRFRARGLTAGPTRLAAGSRWFPGTIPLREVQLVAGQVTTVDLALDGLGELAGVVTNRDEPLRIQVALDGAPCGLVGVERDGRFSLSGLPAGRWTLQAIGDFVASPPLEQQVAPGQVIEGLRLTVEPAASLDVSLVDADDQPVSHARVAVVTPTSHETNHTEPTGHTWFNQLASGAVELRLEDEQALRRVARRRGVAAVRCDPVRVEVRSGEWTSAVLRVVDQP